MVFVTEVPELMSASLSPKDSDFAYHRSKGDGSRMKNFNLVPGVNQKDVCHSYVLYLVSSHVLFSNSNTFWESI